MSLSSTSLPKPKNWQDFENKVRELFACILEDPTTQQNGRSGQKQNGVDVYGYRFKVNLVGVQCKKKLQKSVTEMELRAEVRKALDFTPRISEFILVTTALRDHKIQEVARTITKELSTTTTPIQVVVWGWEDIEENACKYDSAWKAFDPTWNPFVESGFRNLELSIDKLSKSLNKSDTSSKSRSKEIQQKAKHAFALPFNMLQPATCYGRELEIKKIIAVLTRATKPNASAKTAVCIYGMAGIGKTVLATAIVAKLYSVKTSYTVAVWESLRLDPINKRPPDFHSLVDSIITKLSGGTTMLPLSEYDYLQKTDIVLNILCDKRALIVIDNVESILTAYESEHTGYFSSQYQDYAYFLTAIVNGRHNSRMVLTSREPIIGLTTLKCLSIQLDGLDELASVKLLEQYHLSGTQRELLRLAISYDGHPKALELASSLILEDQMYKGNVGSFLNNRSWLLSLDIEKLAYEMVLRLSSEEKKCFARISVYNPDEYPITMESVQALMPDTHHYRLKEVIIRSLCRRSLLSYSARQRSYHYHPVVHELGYKLLSADDEELQDTLRKAYCFFISLPVKENSQWQGIEDLHELLLAFKYACKAGDIVTAAGIVCRENVRRSLVKWGLYRDIIEIYSQLLPVPQQTSQAAPAKQNLVVAYNLLGVAYRNTGNIDASVSCYTKCLEIAQDIGDKFWETVVLGNLAYVYNELQRYEDAIESALKALELAEDVDDKRSQSYALGNLGVSFRNIGRLEESIECLQKDIRVCNSIDNCEGESTAYYELSKVYRLTGDYINAVTSIKHALALNINLNNYNRQLEYILLLCELYLITNDTLPACISIIKAKEVANHVINENLITICNNLYNSIEQRIDPLTALSQCDDLNTEFNKLLTT